jgi:hypothetical protein
MRPGSRPPTRAGAHLNGEDFVRHDGTQDPQQERHSDVDDEGAERKTRVESLADSARDNEPGVGASESAHPDQNVWLSGFVVARLPHDRR